MPVVAAAAAEDEVLDADLDADADTDADTCTFAFTLMTEVVALADAGGEEEQVDRFFLGALARLVSLWRAVASCSYTSAAVGPTYADPDAWAAAALETAARLAGP